MTFETSILGCTTCANSFKHAGDNAAGWAIALMLLLIVPMASAVLFFMIRMARREGAALDPQFNDDYVPPTHNS